MFFCSENPQELDFYVAGNLTDCGGFLHQRRTMNCFVLIYVQKGCLEIFANGGGHRVQSGEWLLMKPFSEHYGISPSQGELSYLWAHFNPSVPFSEAENAPNNAALILPERGKAVSGRIGQIFRQLVDCSRREIYTPRMAKCALEMLLTEITQELLDSRGGRKPLPPLIAEINEWILANCHKGISLKSIADEFHYNPQYLSMLYKKETGQTLTQSVNRSRIEISKRLLLADSRISIKETAFSCGFADEKYYIRLFRRMEGVTPAEYRGANK